MDAKLVPDADYEDFGATLNPNRIDVAKLKKRPAFGTRILSVDPGTGLLLPSGRSGGKYRGDDTAPDQTVVQIIPIKRRMITITRIRPRPPLGA